MRSRRLLAKLLPSSVRVVTLTEAKVHCNVDGSQDDTFVGDLIDAATEYVEAYTGNAYALTSYRLSFPDMSRFPCEIDLSIGNPVSITFLKYIDGNGFLQTMNSGDYSFFAEFGLLRIVDTSIYTLGEPYTTYIEFTAGFTDGTLVPRSVKQAVKLLIGHWYEHREAVSERRIPDHMEFAVDSLLRIHVIRGGYIG